MLFEHDSTPTLSTEFSYDEVDAHLGNLPRYDFDPIDSACACQRKVWDWISQGDSRNMDGFICRCIIAVWVFVPAYRSSSMSDMARQYGKKKQSLGRWVVDFKKAFPELKHIQHIRHDDGED